MMSAVFVISLLLLLLLHSTAIDVQAWHNEASHTSMVVCDPDIEAALLAINESGSLGRAAATTEFTAPTGVELVCIGVFRLNTSSAVLYSASAVPTATTPTRLYGPKVTFEGRQLRHEEREHELATTTTSVSSSALSTTVPVRMMAHRPFAEFTLEFHLLSPAHSNDKDAVLYSVPLLLRTVPPWRLYSWRQHYPASGEGYPSIENGLGRNGSADEVGEMTTFPKYEIQSMSCGPYHCLVSTKQGFVYSWGSTEPQVIGTRRNASLRHSQHQVQMPSHRAGVAVSTVVSSSVVSSIVLTRQGELVEWKTGQPTPAIAFKEQLLPTLDMLSSFGSFFMAASQNRVFSWAPESLVGFNLGREGDQQVPLELEMAGISVYDRVTSMCAGHRHPYGIIVFNQTRLFSFGSGLNTTRFPSGSTPQEYITENSPPWNIRKVAGNGNTVVLLLTNGSMMHLHLTNDSTEAGFEHVNTGSIASQNIIDVSIGVYTGIAIDDDGDAWVWSTLTQSPSAASPKKQPPGGHFRSRPQAVFAYSSWNNFVAYTAPTFHIYADDSNPRPGEICGIESLHCSSYPSLRDVDEATTIIFRSHPVPHRIRTAASEAGVIMQKHVRFVGESQGGVFVDCANIACFLLVAGGAADGFHVQNLIVNTNCRQGMLITAAASAADGGDEIVPIVHYRFTDVEFNGCSEQGLEVVSSSSAAMMLTLIRVRFVNTTDCVKATGLRLLNIQDSALEGCSGDTIQIHDSVASLFRTSISGRGAASMTKAIAVSGGSTLHMRDSHVQGHHSPDVGGGISASDSSLFLVNVTIEDCSAYNRGGGIDLEFTHFLATRLMLQNNSIRSRDPGGGGVALFAIGQRDFQVSDCVVHGHHGGAAVTAIYTSMNWTSCRFSANQGRQGAALSVGTNTELFLEECTFDSNRAVCTDANDGVGGAIFMASSARKLEARHCLFNNNMAEYRGGAIAVDNAADSNMAIQTMILSNNSFNNNTAVAGGGIWFKQALTAEQAANVRRQEYVGNTALQTGADFSSGPSSLRWIPNQLPPEYTSTSACAIADIDLKLQLLDVFDQVISTDSSTNVRLAVSTGNSSSGAGAVLSGEAILSTFEGGQVLFSSSSSSSSSSSHRSFSIAMSPPGSGIANVVARIITFEGTSIVSPELSIRTRECAPSEFINDDACEPCPLGTFSALNSSTSCTPCSPGYFADDESGSTSCTACPPGSFAAFNGSSFCSACPEGRFAAEAGTTSCSECPVNSVPTQDRSACECRPQTVRDDLTDDDAAFVCTECPVGANCSLFGMVRSDLLALPGYWSAVDLGGIHNDSTTTEQFIACPIPAACSGGEQRCDRSSGYRGHLCTECVEGFGRTVGASTLFECEACSDSANHSEMRVTIGLMFTLALVAFLTWNSVKTAPIPNRMKAIAMKIVVSALQFNALAINFDVGWAEPAKTVLGLQNQVTNVGSSILNIDCFYEHRQDNASMFDVPFYTKSLLFLLLPVALMIAPLLFLVPQLIIREMKTISCGVESAWDKFKAAYTTSVIVSMFLVHPSITQHAFQMLNCKTLGRSIGAHPRSFLVADLSQECFVGEHMRQVMFIAMPMMVIHVIGIPVAAACILWRISDRIDEPMVRNQYSWLFRGYNGRHMYWELVVVLRKVLLVLISVFFSVDVQVQGLLAILLITAFLLLHTHMDPFKHRVLSSLEIASLCTTWCTFFLAQFLIARGISPNTKATINLAVLLITVAFMMFCWAMFMKIRLIEMKLKTPDLPSIPASEGFVVVQDPSTKPGKKAGPPTGLVAPTLNHTQTLTRLAIPPINLNQSTNFNLPPVASLHADHPLQRL